MESVPRRALGRGLESLLPAQGEVVIQASVNSIRPGRHQPRARMDPALLEELAASIREHGILQPLVATEERDGAGSWYELVAGERRWRAARAVGLATVPVILRSADEVSRLQLALVENLQREDLRASDRARAYRALIDDFGLTQEGVAKAVGKSRSAVANTLRILTLAPEARDALDQGRITEGHARAILGKGKVGAQLALLRSVLRRGMTVRETERLATSGRHKSVQRSDPETEELERPLRNALGTKVQLKRTGVRGRIVIHFYSDEELDSLVGTLLRASDCFT